MQIGWRALVIVGGLAALVATGCEQEEIRTYDAPKIKERMLAALVPGGEQIWFFKLQGPEAVVAAQKTAFENVLHSIRMPKEAKAPITWTTPPGWKEKPETGMRYATLTLEADESVSIAISLMPQSDVLANVNRWRKQLSLPAVEQADLPKVASTVKIDGVDATVVDFTGVNSGIRPRFGGRAPFAGMDREPPEEKGAASPEVKYTTPPDWKEDPTPAPLSITSFTITDGNQAAKVTITRLGGKAGGMPPNVDRWRQQVGLDPANEEQLRKDVHELDVAGAMAYYVDLTGPEKSGGKRLLAAGLSHEGSTWFFKMTGSADLVGKQKAAFEAFVQSLKFDGGKGANP